MKTDSLKQYVALHDALRKEKSALEERLTQIEDALNGRLSGGGRGKTGRRPRNEMSLRKAVEEATRKRPMNKQEILDEIHRMGYRFSAKDPVNSLNTVLYSKKQFKNVGGKFSPSR
jgi:hypothetical protein